MARNQSDFSGCIPSPNHERKSQVPPTLLWLRHFDRQSLTQEHYAIPTNGEIRDDREFTAADEAGQCLKPEVKPPNSQRQKQEGNQEILNKTREALTADEPKAILAEAQDALGHAQLLELEQTGSFR